MPPAKVSVFTAVMLALSLLFAAAAQAADEDQIILPRSAEITGTAGTGVEFMAIYSCAPRPETVYLSGVVNQRGGGDTDYYEVVTCDGNPHTVKVADGADQCEDGDPCFVPGPATIWATFYQEAAPWVFGPSVVATVMLRWPGNAAA